MALHIYNSYTRKKEIFESITPGYVGMYVCGPTVSGESHLGHARPYISFDVVYRYLTYKKYKVRYVRNITDAGHFEEEGREAEDKVSKKAQIEKLEPMELVQKYTNLFHWAMKQFNCVEPSIEPTATGHIVEQIVMIEDIISKGYAYEVNGSVYFDLKKYAASHDYGKLSGRVIDELLDAGNREDVSRELDGQQEKRDAADFALWKAAPPEHIMRWKSPWGEGFPGWHIECSAMATKYLGSNFDIHGGGMDLLFPHHECEIAQSTACNGKDSVKYWLHNNMITINGQKMGKSLGNFIILDDFFTGDNKLLEQAYSPMTIRFFIMQAHYRSTLDFSNEALQSAEKGLKRLMTAIETLEKLKPSETSTSNIKELEKKCYEAMNDDFNSPILIAHLFEGVRIINSVNDAKESITAEDLNLLKKLFNEFAFEILGLKNESLKSNNDLPEKLMEVILNLRQTAKTNKDFATSDKIRDELKNINIVIKDTKDGAVWSVES